MMPAPQCVLRLYLLDDRRLLDLDRASSIVDRLGARRRVEGASPGWRVIYGTDDHSRAMGMCAQDLGALDPCWFEILDFMVLRPSDRRAVPEESR